MTKTYQREYRPHPTKRLFTPEEIQLIRTTGTAQSWANHYNRSERVFYDIRAYKTYQEVP